MGDLSRQRKKFSERTLCEDSFREMVKTNNIYKAPGNKRYYLNLSVEKKSKIKTELFVLLKKIFEGVSLDAQKKMDLSNFLNEISFEYSPSVFYKQEHNFSNPSFDEFIKETVLYYDLE